MDWATQYDGRGGGAKEAAKKGAHTGQRTKGTRNVLAGKQLGKGTRSEGGEVEERGRRDAQVALLTG